MKPEAHFSPELFKFLKELKRSNNRAWFLANKERYEAVVREPALRFITDLGPRLPRISRYFMADPRPTGGSLMRIYRDTRFSKDKSPYKTNVGIHFSHGDSGREIHAPGFYLHLEPGRSFAAAGSWHPDPASLRRVRDAIVNRPLLWKAVLRSRLPLEGDTLTRPPQGYDPAHPFIEDLKRKDFITSVPLTDVQVASPRFLTTFAAACKTMSPLMAFLTKALGLPW